jgi:cell cycle checkpoint control protein RAD9A
MALLNFTLSEEGVSAFRDALICLNKFSDDVSLEARKDSVCSKWKGSHFARHSQFTSSSFSLPSTPQNLLMQVSDLRRPSSSPVTSTKEVASSVTVSTVHSTAE